MIIINTNYIFVFTLLLLFINICICQIQVSFVDSNQTPQSNKFIKYPDYTINLQCTLLIPTNIYQSDGNGQFSYEPSDSVSSTVSNNTNSLVTIVKVVDIGSGSFDVTIIGNSAQNVLTVNYECLDFEPSNINFEIGGPYYDTVFGLCCVVKASGLPSYSEPAVLINGVSVGANRIDSDHFFFFLNSHYQSLDQDFSEPLKFDFVFRKGTKSVSTPNYFNELVYDTPNITYFPDFNQEITLIGKQLYPLISIETMIQDIQPFYYFAFNNVLYRYTNGIKAIYESCNSTTYLASPYLNFVGVTGWVDIEFYAQNKENPYKVFNKQLNVKDIKTTDFNPPQSLSSGIVEEEDSLLFNIGIAPGSLFLLNRYQFGISGIYRMFDAPFGFISSGMISDNSGYYINLTIPRSAYNPTTLFYIDYSKIEVIDPNNQNAQYSDKPLVTSYEFIYLTNSKYLLDISISSPNCGLGFYSFEVGGIGIRSTAPYLVSGDAFNGRYQIPFDFDIELSFSLFQMIDLCGNIGELWHDKYITSIPFVKFTVPFNQIASSFSIFDIVNVKYLHNNIDCSRQSISNVIYFSHPNLNKRAAIALRIPEMDIVKGSIFFSREFYGHWNESIQMYQIEFVVPKNSRRGPFTFAIAMDLLNYMYSNLLPQSSQLIISKSNFDGIGPIFEHIERIPPTGNKFGWSLNISDPINGFDNGTITVRGSMDNSIYQFKLFPSNLTSGNIHQGTWEIIIQVDSRICVNQNYTITFVKLYDTGGQYSVFELAIPDENQTPYQLANPFLKFFNDSMINKYQITCDNPDVDLTPPDIVSFTSSVPSIDVGLNDRQVTFTLEVVDFDSGINIYSPPIVYLVGESLDTIQSIMKVDTYSSSSVIFKTTIEIPIGFSSTLGVISVSVYGILNNHGLYTGYSSEMLKSSSFAYKILTSYSTDNPLLIQSSRASSKGGEYFVYGRSLVDIEKLTITDAITNIPTDYTTTKLYGSNAISIPDMKPISNDFYVTVTNKSGYTSNRILVSPYLFLDYIPYQDDSNDLVCQGSTSSTNSNSQEELPTNAPQACFGEPLCGGPTQGTCNQTGCVCIYPWKGKSCQDKVLEPSKPDPNPNEPSTSIDVPNENGENSNNNIQYKSLISLHSLREIGINGETVKNYPFRDKWVFNQTSDLKSSYQINITTDSNGFNTTVSATLEWFNQSKSINFANQDLEMSANSIKYSIEISKYPFSSNLHYLQLVMSATLTSTSKDSCSSKDFGDTTSGDNSNYVNIQVDNKSLYGRFIKRGIIDNNTTVSLSNQVLDSSLNAISSPSQAQSFIGITIKHFDQHALIDPDFSILLSSNPATSVCESKGLSGGKIAGIVIGATAFATVIIISAIYYFKKKRESEMLKSNISNKIKEMNDKL